MSRTVEMDNNQSTEEMDTPETRFENQVQNLNNRIASLGLSNASNPSRSEATSPFFVGNVGQLQDKAQSAPFMVRSMQWRMLVIPNHAGLGFFVQCIGRNDSPNWSCNATIELRLVTNKPGEEHYVKGPFNHLFNAEEDDYGYAVFISWQKLLDMADTYVMCKGILLEVQVIADEPQGLEN